MGIVYQTLLVLKECEHKDQCVLSFIDINSMQTKELFFLLSENSKQKIQTIEQDNKNV